MIKGFQSAAVITKAGEGYEVQHIVGHLTGPPHPHATIDDLALWAERAPGFTLFADAPVREDVSDAITVDFGSGIRTPAEGEAMGRLLRLYGRFFNKEDRPAGAGARS